jgi:transposase, IS6 family
LPVVDEDEEPVPLERLDRAIGLLLPVDPARPGHPKTLMLLAEAARPCRHLVGTRWWVDETYVKVAGQWRYVYRAIDQLGQVVNVFVSPRRHTTAARRFLQRAIGTTKVTPVEVVTDLAATCPAVLEDLLPAARHCTDQYANTRVEADHGRLKARLWPMRGLKQDRNARVIRVGHAFVQNVRRGHYELATGEPTNSTVGRRVRRTGRGHLIPCGGRGFAMHWLAAMQQHHPSSPRVLPVRGIGGGFDRIMAATAGPKAIGLRLKPRLPFGLKALTATA